MTVAPWRAPVPEVIGECPPHRLKYLEDGRHFWERVCSHCALGQRSLTGPILYWTHFCHGALGKTTIVVWWPNDRFERTNYMGKPVKFCRKCGGGGCTSCGGTGTVG